MTAYEVRDILFTDKLSGTAGHRLCSPTSCLRCRWRRRVSYSKGVAQHLKPDLIDPDPGQIVLAPMAHHRCWCYRLLFR